jgi:hypothetical protein
MDNYDNGDAPRDMTTRMTAFRHNLRVMLSRVIYAKAKSKPSVGMIVTRSDGRIGLCHDNLSEAQSCGSNICGYAAAVACRH